MFPDRVFPVFVSHEKLIMLCYYVLFPLYKLIICHISVSSLWPNGLEHVTCCTLHCINFLQVWSQSAYWIL